MSRLSRGGTLETYFRHISALVRYCWFRNIPFHKVVDEDFSDFVEKLKRESREHGNERVPVRDSSSVLNIGCRCLDFLEFIGKLHAIDNFIGDENCKILAERRAILVGAANSQSKRVVNVWHHASFPRRTETRRRHAIGFDYIVRLRRAAAKAGKSSFVRQRRLVLLRLLEATGGRRCEIRQITVADIEEALRSAGPHLRLYSAKRKGSDKSDNPHRFVKITFNDLDYIQRYIEMFRLPVIDGTIGCENDGGALLISEKTGLGLVDGTITSELRVLRVFAEIKGKAHPHIFRHRFVTVRLMELIRSHRVANRSEFELLFKLEGFKKEVAEQTGHMSLASLDVYLDWAFIELAGGDDASRAFVDMAQVAASVKSSVAELDALRRVLSPEEYTMELEHRYRSMARDMDALETRERAPGSKLLHDVTQS